MLCYIISFLAQKGANFLDILLPYSCCKEIQTVENIYKIFGVINRKLRREILTVRENTDVNLYEVN